MSIFQVVIVCGIPLFSDLHCLRHCMIEENMISLCNKLYKGSIYWLRRLKQITQCYSSTLLTLVRTTKLETGLSKKVSNQLIASTVCTSSSTSQNFTKTCFLISVLNLQEQMLTLISQHMHTLFLIFFLLARMLFFE